MKPRLYRFTLIFITVTIVATIALQLHWNIRNYRQNKRQLLSEIQSALDSGVESYFAEKSKRDVMVFADSLHARFPDRFVQTGDVTVDSLRQANLRVRKLSDSSKRVVNIFRSAGVPPEMIKDITIRRRIPPPKDMENVVAFTTKIISAVFSDSIDIKKLNENVSQELARKNISIDYNLQHFTESLKRHPENPDRINSLAKSTFLPHGDNVRLSYDDPTALTLRRSSTEIILSLLLSLSIIGSLLYLLHIINRQKKIDEIRNDLISNITHEFKTPITTVIAAIDGIRNFNQQDDKEKTNRYLDISERQMAKLQIMVEKLLDTATLETDEIALRKQPVDIVKLLHSIIEKYQLYAASKVSVTADLDREIIIAADEFHLENAISNLIDNAIKYGGDQTNVRIEQRHDKLEIFVEDNGGGIHGWHRERIFEKFYRIPTGNVHDVKGFGIGLFYSKKIVEKHGGELELVPNNEMTIFKITLPYA
jgi:two-component system phosphate regulon sensor histidine kinase PhoR